MTTPVNIHDHILADLHEIIGERATRERWWSAAAAPTEKNAIGKDLAVPFVATSGNDTWGVAIPVIGSRDDPAAKGTSSFHIHRINIVASSEDSTYMIRFLYGSTSLEEAAQAQRYTEKMVVATAAHPLAGGGRALTIRCQELQSRHHKVWCQVWNVTNLATLTFFLGCHGHDLAHVEF